MNYILDKKNLNNVLSDWSKTYEVYAPHKNENFSQFQKFDGEGELAFENPHNTRFPPKALFLPQSEALLKYTRQGRLVEADLETQKRIVFGIRPCDAHAVTLLDTVFEQEQYSDPYWKARRENTVIVGLGCHAPTQTCFCTTVGSGPFSRRGLDALLTDMGDHYLVEPITDKGKSLFESFSIAPEKETSMAKDIQEKATASLPIAFPTEGLKQKLADNFDHPYWEEISSSCLGCGICTFLCPTCFCFDIVDEVQRSERVRNWDTCMFRTYSLEASGHNPRPTRKERTRQRINHKFNYWLDQINEIGCTGCGRCIRYCPVGLDIRAMLIKAASIESEAAHVL